MNCICRLFNWVCSIGRIYRFCKSKKFMPLTNCNTVNTSDKPTSIVTWNIQGLFIHMNKTKTKNILNQLLFMKQTDIFCLQEVFEDHLKEEIIYTMKETHPYYLLGNTHKRYVIGEDSGLLILSKYPIQFVKEFVLDDYFFPDRMANKSILYFKVGCLNVMTTHLQSDNMFYNKDISNKQLKLIKYKAPFDKFIITGDLNNENAEQQLSIRKNNIINTWWNGYKTKQILDYILPYNYEDILTVFSTSVPNIDITNISDHYPLKCQLIYK